MNCCADVWTIGWLGPELLFDWCLREAGFWETWCCAAHDLKTHVAVKSFLCISCLGISACRFLDWEWRCALWYAPEDYRAQKPPRRAWKGCPQRPLEVTIRLMYRSGEIGGGGCDVRKEGGRAEERGMDNEKRYQFFMSVWKLCSRSESPNTILYL